jgi:hypothetical protein
MAHYSNIISQWYTGVEANLTNHLQHHIQTILLLLMNYDHIPLIYAEALHVLSEIYNACGNGGLAFIKAICLLKMDLDTHHLFQLLHGQVDIHIHNMADEEVDKSKLPDLVD